MAEGDFSPVSGPPKPLSAAQLARLRAQFKQGNEIIQKVGETEKKDKAGKKVSNPEWI